MSSFVHDSILRNTPRPKLRALWSTLSNMRAVSRQRRQLRHLDDHLLKDIGLTRQDAVTESRQSAWNVPVHWRK